MRAWVLVLGGVLSCSGVPAGVDAGSMGGGVAGGSSTSAGGVAGGQGGTGGGELTAGGSAGGALAGGSVGGGVSAGGMAGGASAGGSSAGGASGGSAATVCPTPAMDPVQPSGVVLRVATSGMDQGDCRSAPCRSIQFAADRVSAEGTVVEVAAGAYAGFRARFPGTIFRGLPGATINSGAAQDRIFVDTMDRVVIEGFRVQNATRAGIWVVESSDVVIRNNVVEGSGKWGILTGYCDRVRIIGNDSSGTPSPAGEHGVYVGNSRSAMDAPVICGNTLHDNWGNGLQLNGDCDLPGDGTVSDGLVEANDVYRNGQKGMSIISAPRTRIRNNLVYDNGTRNQGAGGIHLTIQPNCPVMQASSACQVDNNTIVETRIAAMRITDGARDNVTFNNVFVGRTVGYDDAVGMSQASNNLQGTSASAVGLDPASWVPRASSSARDTGVTSFMGVPAPANDKNGLTRSTTTPDRGAIEVP